MKISEDSEERAIAWQAILEDTPVYSADGEEIGAVREVVGAEDADIFHGIVVSAGVIGNEALIPAEAVGQITNRRIETTLSSEEVRALPAFVPEESYQLGFVGFLRRHLGWVREEDR